MIAACIRLANLWLNGRLAAAVGSDLSCESYQDFTSTIVHIQRNTAENTSITTQIGVTVLALNAFLQLATASLVSVGLLIGLLLIDAQVARDCGSFWLCGLLAVTVRRQLRRNGLRIADISSRQIKALQEGLGAIRDVLLDGTQHLCSNVPQC